MAKNADKAESLSSDFNSMTLEERERSVRTDVQRLEQEERICELEKRRETLVRRRSTIHSRRPDSEEDEQPATTSMPAAMTAPPHDGGGPGEHSTYGRTRSRQRSRECHRRHRSKSGSGSRSRSSSRRRRSKWSLKRFTVSSKEVRKLNAYELIEASSKWCLNIEDLTVKDYRVFIQHMAFIANRAKSDEFKDCAHTEYDAEIRKLAETIGFAAFSKANNGESVLHYGLPNTRPRKTSKQESYRKSNQKNGGKRPCFRWNREGGCDQTEDKCGFGHYCGKCSSRSHGRHSCTKV